MKSPFNLPDQQVSSFSDAPVSELALSLANIKQFGTLILVLGFLMFFPHISSAVVILDITLNTSSTTFTEGGAGLLLASSATATDPDTTDFQNGSLQVSISANGTANDKLAVKDIGSGTGQIGVAGSIISYGIVDIATVSGGTDGSTPLVISFNKSNPVSLAAVDALLQAITYQNVSNDPSLSARTIQFQLTDPDSNVSNSASMSVLIENRVFTVTNNADSGTGSLRKAILDANSDTGFETITFSISGEAPFMFQPLSALPTITETVTIDGYSHSQASVGSSSTSFNAVIAIIIEGNSAGTGVNGLTIEADTVTIKGLNILGFDGNGILIDGSSVSGVNNNVIVGNILGDSSGGFEFANGGDGIRILDSASNTIGGTGVTEKNLISGNNGNGVAIVDSGSGTTSTGNKVEGNLIGTNSDGTSGVRNNESGVFISGAQSNTIGGCSSSAGNVISGNGALSGATNPHGITIDGDTADNNVIKNNLIGTTSLENGTIGNNSYGIYIKSADFTTIGASGEGNVIGGNSKGIVFETGADGNTVKGNFIGTDSSATSEFENTNVGLSISASNNNTIGSISSGDGNTIAFNGSFSTGLTISSGTGNAIRGNSMFSNLGLAIDLPESVGATDTNDAGDGDTGANNLQNSPIIDEVKFDNGDLTINFRVDSSTFTSAGDSTYPLAIDFYIADSSGEEGQTYLGTVTYASGDAQNSVTKTFTPGSTVLSTNQIVATATDSLNNTSEFSSSLDVTEVIRITNTNDDGTGSLRQALSDASAGDQITFDTSGSITLSSGELSITKKVLIEGPFTIDANNSSRIFNISSSASTVFLLHLTITGGNASHGGGVLNNANLTLHNVVLTGNTATGSSTGGGGLFNDSSGTAVLNITTVSNNTATGTGSSFGGGIYNSGGNLTINQSAIHGNSAPTGGGGLFNDSGVVEIRNSTFSGNSGPTGGGISNVGLASAASVSMVNVTVASNSGTSGSAVANQNLGSSAIVDYGNSIFADNSSGSNFFNSGGILTTNGNNISDDGTGITNGVSNDQQIDPELNSLADNGGSGVSKTHAFSSSSPAIDGGNGSLVSASVDQRNFSRVVDGNGDGTSTVDIGAFEGQRPILSFSGGDLNYTENGLASALDTGGAGTVQDDDNTNFSGGVLKFEFTVGGTANDRLEVVNVGTGTGQIGVSGSNITYETGPTLGTFSGGTDGSTPLEIALNSSASNAAVTALFRNVAYSNVSENPTTAARAVAVTLKDGLGTVSSLSLPPKRNIVVSSVNDVPLISDILNQSTNEGTATDPIAFTISDAETTDASLTLSFASSNDTLVPDTPDTNFSFGGFDGSRTVTITPVTGQHGTTTITVTVTDLGGLTCPGFISADRK